MVCSRHHYMPRRELQGRTSETAKCKQYEENEWSNRVVVLTIYSTQRNERDEVLCCGGLSANHVTKLKRLVSTLHCMSPLEAVWTTSDIQVFCIG